MYPLGMKKSLIIVLSVAILLLSIICLVSQIKDPDFFWHLKSGELLWKQGSLPTKDIFAYTSPPYQNDRVHFVLTGFWLSQLLFYLMYALGGMPGIVALRFVLIGILVCVMMMRKKGDLLLYVGLLLICLAIIMTSFPLERPQVLSFLFFAILLLLLERLSDDTNSNRGKWIYFAFPAMMLLWANIHPGFVLGLTAIAIYIISEGIKYLHPSLRPMKLAAYRKLVLLGLSGILVAALNPNAYHVFSELSPHAFNTAGNIEYFSTPKFFTTFGDFSLILYWLLLLLTFSGLIINIRRVDITALALLAGTAYFSFTTVRYVPLFVIAALPTVSNFFSEGKFLKPARILVITIAIISCVVFTWNRRANLDNLTSRDWISGSMFPVKAAEFVINNNLKGNMFNPHFWGGYLMWTLGPERKVFIDGRDLYPNVFADYRLIKGVATHNIVGMPAWKAMLYAYNVNYVITPLVHFEGGSEPLTNALLTDKDWVPVFADDRSVIFMRDTPANSDVVTKYAIPKDNLKAVISDMLVKG
jgi:hypothetical protein